MPRPDDESVRAFLENAPPLLAARPPVDGWRMEVERSGSWGWEKHPTGCDPLLVYATPFWEGHDGIPVEYPGDDGMPAATAATPFILTGDLEADVAAYVEAIRPFLRPAPIDAFA